MTVARALDYNRGDGEIQASMELYRYFAYPHGSESAEPFVTNRVRMLAADGRIYVNARDLFTEMRRWRLALVPDPSGPLCERREHELQVPDGQ